MRASILVMLYLLSGCVVKTSDPRLEGTWTSDKEMTLRNMKNGNLTKEQHDFLARNLGVMQYVHRGSKVAIAFLDTPDEPLNFERFSVVASGSDTVTLQRGENEIVNLNFIGNCFYISTEWKFDEYFCKSK